LALESFKGVAYPGRDRPFAARTEQEVRVMATGTEVTEAAAVKPGPGAGANGAGDGLSEIVTFPDLVRAHRAWELELYESTCENRRPHRALERRFQEKRSLFEDRYGCIEAAYWSVRDASAVAYTVKKKPKLVRRWRHEHVPRFHRASDWATRDEPMIAAALDDCESLAVRTEEILRGPSELIALRRIYAVASQLLGYVDRVWGREPPASGLQAMPNRGHQARCKEFVDDQQAELKEIRRFYDRTGDGQAKILFFWGMVQGLLGVAVVTFLVGAATWPADRLDGGATHWGELQLLAICVMTGALGAFLSVLQRMASLDKRKFTIDFEVGRTNVRWLGIYRPCVGGIFGLATFLLLASGILQTENPPPESDYAYYGILAFFSGFFERFTKVPTDYLSTGDESSKTDKDDSKKEREASGS
jgi:hypothetical protein